MQHNHYPGMIQWSSPEYEQKIIADFEKSWEDIQVHWISMEEMRSQADDLQLCTLLERFSGYLDDVYDDGELAEGSASYLFKKWISVSARTEQCWVATPGTLFLRRLGRFGHLLEGFKNKEPLYDVIRAYQGTVSDDE
jgi:hypothetical protein